MNNRSIIIDEMIKIYSGDVKRINHFLKVYSFAKIIGELENLEPEQQELVEIAAIVHDIGIKVSEKKYNSSIGKYQQIEGPILVKELLNSLGFEHSLILRISYLVGHHHMYQAIDDLVFQILVEADFLVNIYEDQMNQTMIETIKKKYFKTSTGINFLERLYKKTI